MLCASFQGFGFFYLVRWTVGAMAGYGWNFIPARGLYLPVLGGILKCGGVWLLLEDVD